MPMMAVYEQNDARHSARLLATMALREIEGQDEVQETVMLNMYRLLDGFRAHSFYAVEDDHSAEDEFSSTSMVPSGERHFSEVRVALEHTVDELGGDRNALLTGVEDVLRAKAYPDIAQADDEALDRAKRFIGSLIEHLRHIGN
jgi:flagellar motor component MotA